MPDNLRLTPEEIKEILPPCYKITQWESGKDYCKGKNCYECERIMATDAQLLKCQKHYEGLIESINRRVAKECGHCFIVENVKAEIAELKSKTYTMQQMADALTGSRKAAKREGAEEIEHWLELHLMARPDHPTATMKFSDWMKLKKILAKSSTPKIPEHSNIYKNPFPWKKTRLVSLDPFKIERIPKESK